MIPSQNLLESMIEMIAERVVVRLKQQPATPALRPRLLSLKQAAEYLSRSPSAISNMVYRGKLKCVRLDSKLCFDVADLDRMIEQAKEGQ